MTITVVGNNINDINGQLGRYGPSFDILIKFRREDWGRRHGSGAVMTRGNDGPVVVEYLTSAELIAAFTEIVRQRDEWLERTDGGTKEDTPR